MRYFLCVSKIIYLECALQWIEWGVMELLGRV